MPLNSIWILVYHESKYLRKYLESILNQLFTNFELLLVFHPRGYDRVAIIKEVQEWGTVLDLKTERIIHGRDQEFGGNIIYIT